MALRLRRFVYICINSSSRTLELRVACFLWEVYLHSGTELIPLFPYLRAGLKRGGGGGDGGIAPGNRLLATDHGLTGFPDLKVNPGLGL